LHQKSTFQEAFVLPVRKDNRVFIRSQPFVGHFQRPNGEYVLIHHCHGCGFERFNRIAADDDFDLVLSLPAQSPRTGREVKAMQAETWLEEHPEEWDLDVEEAG